MWSRPAFALQPLEVAYLPDDNFPVEAIAQAPSQRWQSIKPPLSLGFTTKPHWLRILIPPLPEPQYLVITNPLLDYLRFYQLREIQWMQTMTTGDRLPFAQRPIPQRNFIAPLAASEAEQTLYLWVQTDGLMQVPLQLMSPQTLAQSEQQYLFAQGIYYGFFLAIALFAAFLWVNQKERTYAVFGLLMLACASIQGVYSGLGFAYLWPEFPAINSVAMPLCLAGAVALAARFALMAFRLDSAQWSYYACQGMLWCALVLFAVSPFLSLGIALKACLLLIALHSIIQMCLGVYWLYKRRPGSSWYCAAWVVFLLRSSAFMLSSWGVLTNTPNAYFFGQATSLVAAILLTCMVCSLVKHAYIQRLSETFTSRTQQSNTLAHEQSQAHNLAQAVAEKTAALQAALSEVNKLNLELSKQTITDSLTGLFNRRHFDHLLENEVRRAAREHRSISLVLIDVDHFKKINDTYGHPVGDDCLIQLARLLRHIVRQPPDILFRSGGEEMALLLPGSDAAGAQVVAEKMCNLVAASEFCYPSGCLQLTLSLGVGSLVPSLNTQSRELFELADEALYLAKNRGRNRVESLARGEEPVDWG